MNDNITSLGLTEVFFQSIICETCEVTWTEIMSKDRYQRLVIPRQIYAHYATYFLGQRQQTIADALGGRDRSDISRYLKKNREQMWTNDPLIVVHFQRIDSIISKKFDKKVLVNLINNKTI